MSRLFITEYSHLTNDHAQRVVSVPMTPPGQEQSIEIDVTSIQSKPFKDTTRFICVHTESSCALAFGTDPIASPDLHGLGTGETRFYGVQPNHKIAVIGAL